MLRFVMSFKMLTGLRVGDFTSTNAQCRLFSAKFVILTDLSVRDFYRNGLGVEDPQAAGVRSLRGKCFVDIGHPWLEVFPLPFLRSPNGIVGKVGQNDDPFHYRDRLNLMTLPYTPELRLK